MKWIVRWTDLMCDEREETFDDLGVAIERMEKFSTEIDRIRLFLDAVGDGSGHHVATYYTPQKGYWS